MVLYIVEGHEALSAWDPALLLLELTCFAHRGVRIFP